MPVAYTDLFNEALDDLATKLNTVTGLTVVTDPRNLAAPCCLINAPSFTTPFMTNKAVQLTFPVQIITLGPYNLDAQRSLLNTMAKVLSANVAVTDGRPTSVEIGGVLLPAYEMTVNMKATV